MQKKILVVVDDRVVTQSAIRQAIELAKEIRAVIHFFYVLPVQVISGFDIFPVSELSPQEFKNQATAHADEMLDAACELAGLSGIQSFCSIGSDTDHAHCVSIAAEKKNCQLIVVGTEGKNAMLRILNGSIVPGLISVASVPVLVCRDMGSSGGFGRRVSVSIRARQRRQILQERRERETND
jgi:nucleotide-binding universal stress UspA family protein